MIRLRFADVRRPRFLAGVLRQRFRVGALAVAGRDIEIDLDGLQVRLPARDNLVRQLLEEDFERAERDFIRRVLRPGDVFVDIGAHVGVHTLGAARAVTPGGRVYAFEPNPATFNALVHNVAANDPGGVVKCTRVAVSDSAARGLLHIPSGGYAAHSSLAVPHVDVATGVEVHTARLDDLISDVPTLVKIDVEGWERRVIAGSHRLLEPPEAPHLLIEFADVTAGNAGETTSELADDLEQLGYRLFRYVPRTRALSREERAERYGGQNLVATKRLDDLEARLS